MTESQVDREALPVDKTPAGIEIPMIEETYTHGPTEGEPMANTEIMSEVRSDHDVVFWHELLTGVSILAAVVNVASDKHFDDMSKFLSYEIFHRLGCVFFFFFMRFH